MEVRKNFTLWARYSITVTTEFFAPVSESSGIDDYRQNTELEEPEV